MREHRLGSRAALLAALAALAVALLTAGVAGAGHSRWVTLSDDFESPLFGLAKAPRHGLIVADAGAGPTEVHRGSTQLLAELPGVTDVLPLGRHGAMLALTGGIAPRQALHHVSRGGEVTEIADLLAFETTVDPAADGVESNPFDLARLHGKTLVADAAGNSILVVNRRGEIDWVAALPQHNVSTQPLKDAVGCPAGPVDVCGLPPRFDADPVATSVAIGPDGYIYVGELTGFPATPGTSRVWRIKPGARHALCGTSNACSIVKRGFTSIIDIQFGRRHGDDIAYVVELDEASWLGMEEGRGVGGTVNACDVDDKKWSCEKFARRLPMPTAVAIDGRKVYATLNSLVPGEAEVARLR